MSYQPSAISRQQTAFDPATQLDNAFAALETAVIEAQATLGRIGFARERLQAEVDEMRRERDALEVFTEAEAAEMLKLGEHCREGRAEEHLGELRRQLDLPHCKLGTKVRYTREHLREIVAALEVRKGRQRSAVSGQRGLRAA